MQGVRVNDVARGESFEQTRCTTPLYAGILVHFEKLVKSDLLNSLAKPLGITSDNVRLSGQKILSRNRICENMPTHDALE